MAVISFAQPLSANNMLWYTNYMLIEDALKQATDAQVKSEWARRTQAMRKSRGGGRKPIPRDAIAESLRDLPYRREPIDKITSQLLQVPPRSSHDPKTCRVYKCGQCAILTSR